MRAVLGMKCSKTVVNVVKTTQLEPGKRLILGRIFEVLVEDSDVPLISRHASRGWKPSPGSLLQNI